MYIVHISLRLFDNYVIIITGSSPWPNETCSHNKWYGTVSSPCHWLSGVV